MRRKWQLRRLPVQVGRRRVEDKDGNPLEVHHHGMEVHRKLADGTWAFFIDHPFGADLDWGVAAPPETE
ncbi:hypothetical protein [Phyllobacterium sp. P5_D12]